VVWKAFELRPGTPPEGIPRPLKDGETNELTGNLREAAEAAGLESMRRASLTPNGRPALEAAAFAKDKGKFDEYHTAVFKAFWEESRDIGEAGVLRGILEACGLDWDEYGSPGNADRYSQQVDREVAESRGFGITGIPAFILDRYLLMGAQPYDVFRQAMEHIQRERGGEDAAP
jgi:predicted DsbA family dithiol-disulfide isomerase